MNFPYCVKLCSTTIHPQILSLILQWLQLNLVCVQESTLHQKVTMIIKMWVSIDHKVHLIDEENIVICVHFDSGATFYCENINWERKKSLDYAKTSKITRITINVAVFLMTNVPKASLWTHTSLETSNRKCSHIIQPPILWVLKKIQTPQISNFFT